MKATESEIAPSVAGQSLKMCFPGRKKGREGVVSGIQGAADGGDSGEIAVLPWLPHLKPGWNINVEGRRAPSAETDSWN